MIWWLNLGVGAFVDVVMAPLRMVPPTVGLAVLALLTAVGMLLILRVTLNRTRIEEAKQRIHAALFEVRLYKDDARAMLRAALEVGRYNVAYLRAWMVPMLALSLPVALLMAQIEAYYGYEGLTVHQPALVVADLRTPAEPRSLAPDLVLDAPSPLVVDTPAIWFPSVRRVAWHITARSEGSFVLKLRSQTSTLETTVQAVPGIARRSVRRVRAGFLNELLYPSDRPLSDDGPIESMTVGYPENRQSLLGWQVHWLTPFLGFTFIFAYALRRSFGVVF